MTAGWSVNRRAVRAIEMWAPAEERGELLQMLGLVDEHGAVRPDDTRIYQIDEVNDSLPAVREDDPRVRSPWQHRLTSPPGLRLLPPLPSSGAGADEGSTGRTGRPRGKPPVRVKGPPPACGTLAGRSRHVREGEPVCPACMEAQRESHRLSYARNREKNKLRQRQYRAEARKRREAERAAAVERGELPPPKPKQPPKGNPNLPSRPEACGSLAGRAAHLYRREEVCPRCREFYRLYQQERRRRNTARQQDTSSEEKSA